MPRKKFFSLREAVAMLEEEEDITAADIVVLPPAQTDENSDCEQVDENNLIATEQLPDDVAGHVEVQYADDQYLNDVSEKSTTLPLSRRSSRSRKPNPRYELDRKRLHADPSPEPEPEPKHHTKKPKSGDDEPRCDITATQDDTKSVTRPKPKSAAKSQPVKWTQKPPKYSSQPVQSEKHALDKIVEHLVGKTEEELFREFFDDEVVNTIVEETIRYASQENRHSFHLTGSQMLRFIGFLLFTGYHKLPREDMYWENSDDCSIRIVTNAMSRQVFRDIKRNLHLNDNSNIDREDKLYKIRRYTDMLNAKFLKFGVFSQNLSIDEQMIPYYGRHPCKMFMRGKPVRFGFKSWCLCSSDGFLFQFMPYAGRDENFDADLGLGASVVMHLLCSVENPQYHAVYFDNFFTSHKLMIKLSENGFHATGTVREQRLIASELEDTKSLQKKERGVFDWRFDNANNILAVKWNDNSVVTLATNFETVEPLLSAKRFSRSEKKSISVPQPNLIAAYNRYMGGVDLLDSFVAQYRIAVKGKKWWWPIFVNYVDVALCNAWRMHRLVHGKELDLLEFRRRVCIALLTSVDDSEPAKTTDKLHGRLSALKKLSHTRPSGFCAMASRHAIAKNPDGRRVRCRQCKSTTSYVCLGCTVGDCYLGIHAKCFTLYHS